MRKLIRWILKKRKIELVSPELYAFLNFSLEEFGQIVSNRARAGCYYRKDKVFLNQKKSSFVFGQLKWRDSEQGRAYWQELHQRLADEEINAEVDVIMEELT